ncbi:MAG: hypothetical protein GY898_29310 [Proteobacteria bacterium]|nr:hypothetical protein [Pseudomonadota bacterium]
MDRLILVGVVVALLLVLVWIGGRGSRVQRRRMRRALRAEDRAEALLERAGYVIEDRQLVGAWPMVVDGEEVDATLRADLLVRKRRRLYIAEVKSGPVASRPTDPSTRRQLLEYRLAFDVDGVLLVDMHRRRILTIEFPDA